MATLPLSTKTKLPKGFAYRSVIVVNGITYYSERLYAGQAEGVLRFQPLGLVRIERALTKNGLLNGEVDELEWERI
jgi:hypothetical protein